MQLKTISRPAGLAGLAALAAAVAGGMWLSSPLRAEDAPSPVDLAQKAETIFQNNCVGCHGATNPRAGLDLTSHQSVIDKKDVIPGDSAHSKLIKMVVNGKMPPGPKKLSADDIALLKQWVDAGAADWAPAK